MIRQLTWREVIGRYKGSMAGLGWSFIQPLLMLFVYTFVFSVIFKAKWGVDAQETRGTFALALFMGLITFNIFADVVTTAPMIVLDNVNYVKKVVFPIEVLPFVRFLSAFTNAVISLSVLAVGILVVDHSIHWTIVCLPLVWLPVMMFSLGCGYFLASLGVFLRDVGATIGILTNMLFFLTPIFYPVSAVPEKFLFFCKLNPMAAFVENSRKVVLWGLLPDWDSFLIGLVISLFVMVTGFLWFMKSKKSFADVI
ncbi:putative ABC-type transporter, permease protein [Desulforapulum autotrophicum HRM2]|uniref:Transport permease protein n=1 Tax=Desulforapulum autotrophicum (strain ATCC 43914 / DSM 3382 / VKM B-1955 / HRM2) TaxID=177437 RepID=C0QK56_DESAH|nr:putative ABC-type transporter, permease protein [Desulforapulum autotrophicum HRM2]